MPKLIPPALGKYVTYRTWSWEMLVAKEWGPAFKQPDHGIYQFSDGRRFDSTDQYRTGVYGAVPSVTAPVLSLTSIATGNQLTWTPATIAGSTISAYIVYRSLDGLNYSQLAVVQGSASAYFDGFLVQSVVNLTDSAGDQLVDPTFYQPLGFVITSADVNASYYLIAESAIGSASAPSNVVTA